MLNKKADIKTITERSTHLDPQERNELYKLLRKYECLFDGNLGTCHGKPYDIKLKPDAESYHGKTFPVPRIHELTFRQELDRLEALKVNTSKSYFGAHKFDYLGYHVTRDGVMNIPKKVEAIQSLAVPKTRKKLCHFICMINFYRYMWKNRSELLAPVNALTSKNVKYDWKYE